MDLSVIEEMDVEVQKMTEKRLNDDLHSYSCRSKKGGECDSFPNTPSKTRPPKKLAKGDNVTSEIASFKESNSLLKK